MGDGVRKLKLGDIAPACEILINRAPYELSELAAGKRVLDLGCGYGPLRPVVEAAGGEWIGVEPFAGGSHSVAGDAMRLPFRDASFDVVVLWAVLEHIPDPSRAFAEVSRVLRPGGLMVGYVAFMECFHEISYSHLSFKALEYFAGAHGMLLERVSGGHRFGIDYHLSVLLFPLPTAWMRRAVSASLRAIFRAKSRLAGLYLRWGRRMDAEAADRHAQLYYAVECLRQSVGFSFVIRKLAPGGATS